MLLLFHFFFFNVTATTEIYTLSLHDALPICPLRAGVRDPRAAPRPRRAARRRRPARRRRARGADRARAARGARGDQRGDRKSTRLNSSHSQISYAVFCLKKKK